VTLVTQNPVDIDYKGLTNTGTWFIGRLQAERDKEKVIEGLRGAIMGSGGVEGETDYGLLINKLSSRVFILHNIHQGPPVVFQTRWAMSYLRGPLTKPQIETLMKDKRITTSSTISQPSSVSVISSGLSQTSPIIDPRITQVYVSDSILLNQQGAGFNQTFQTSSNGQLMYEPKLMARAAISYYDKRLGVDRLDNFILLLSSNDSAVEWDQALRLSTEKVRFSNSPRAAASYGTVPSQFNTQEKIQNLGRSLPDYLLRSSRLKISTHKDLKITQQQGEDERAFSIRVRDAARERRDSEVQKIQDDYESKISKIETKIKSLERSLQSDQDEVKARKREEYLGVGETVLGFFIGRRRSTGITTASRRRRMTQQAQNDVEKAQGKLSDLKKDVDELEAELKDAVGRITRRWDGVLDEVSTIEIKPSRSEIDIDLLALAWVPS
jgi:phage host-nuclease inhibitor protein Gam